MSRIDKIDYLDNCINCTIKMLLFRHFSEEELLSINKDRFVMRFKAGELIYKQGSSYSHLISLTSGIVKLYLEIANKNVITQFIKPVEFISGPGMYIDNKHHNSAAAVEDCVLCFIDVNNFKNVIRKNGVVAEELLRINSSKTIPVFERVASLSVKQMPGLVAETLIYLSDNIYQNKVFPLTISVQDIAEFCGVAKESVLRMFKNFMEHDLIKFDKNQVEIIDSEKLKIICDKG